MTDTVAPDNVQTPLDFSVLRVSGEQNKEFLQGQLSCDIAEVTSSQSRLGVHCNAKGRVIATFRIFYLNSDYYLLLPSGMAEVLLQAFKKYALFYQVHLQEVSDEWNILGLSGSLLIDILSKEWPALSFNEPTMYHYDNNIVLVIPGKKARAILASHHKPVSVKILHLFKKHMEIGYWDYLDIHEGLVSINENIQELFTPHQIDYHKKQGISFTKGCYTGQEVIARMHYLGKLKNQLYKIKTYTQMSLYPGLEIRDEVGQVRGTLIMSVPIPRFDQEHFLDRESAICKKDYIGLASLQNNAIDGPLFFGKDYIEVIPLT